MSVVKHIELSASQARSIAISAQGLRATDHFSSTQRDIRHLRWAFTKLGVLQIDAVNAIARSHLLVLRARLGSCHDNLSKLLQQGAYDRREFTEYWCHEASYLPVKDLSLFAWRMRRAEQGEVWKGIRKFAAENPNFIKKVARYVARHGPVSAGQLQSKPKSAAWWAWSEAKIALEWLFWIGEVSVSHRNNFTRFYDVTSKVLPAGALDNSISEVDAHYELIRRAANHLGIASTEDLIDYFRLPKIDGRQRVIELVEREELLPVQVDGWDRIAYLPANAQISDEISKSVLLSPFDPLVWFRPRTQRLFDFKYRLEIYVPAAKRIHGYYVLPFLHDNQLSARVDLKADMKTGVLHVFGVYSEADRMNEQAIDALATELQMLATWRGLDTVRIGQRGDLARKMRKVI